MAEIRKIERVLTSVPTIEGAGVRLHRVFGYNEVPLLDPFLLLDDFSSGSPDDYLAGFPWHPHRGIETVTYMIHGEVAHGDSIGSRGLIRGGDVQWMTAGRGIIHSEMPQRGDGSLSGFQLWVNLPAEHKMMHPRYRDVKASDIPIIRLDNGVRARVICGEFGGTKGPVQDLVVDAAYLDVTVPAAIEFEHRLKRGHRSFAYVFEGGGSFDPEKTALVHPGQLVIYGDGDLVRIRGGKKSIRFLLISGIPLGEPVAWRGPIVMNTEEELGRAFEEYRNGTFIQRA